MPVLPTGAGQPVGRRRLRSGPWIPPRPAGSRGQNGGVVRFLLLVVAAVVLLLAGACQVDTEVALEAGEGGDGRVRVTVTLDEEAARRMPDLVRDLRVDDLRQAGWSVDGPYPTPERGAEVEATKRFDSPAELGAIAEEIGGAGGPFQGFTLDVDEQSLRTRSAFRGTVDLGGGLAAFSDAALTEKLGGEPLGVPLAEIEERAGVPLDRVFVFRVVARLPGRVRANTPSVDGGTATWTPRLGERLDLVADAELARPSLRRIGIAGALVLAVVAAAVTAVRVVTRRRRSTVARR